jgi:excisionase family DNA binding protein
MPRSSPSAWLTREQVADYAQVHLSTVKRWIATGELDVIRIGRAVRIAPEALADLQHRRTHRAVDNQGSSRRRARRKVEGAA